MNWLIREVSRCFPITHEGISRRRRLAEGSKCLLDFRGFCTDGCVRFQSCIGHWLIRIFLVSFFFLARVDSISVSSSLASWYTTTRASASLGCSWGPTSLSHTTARHGCAFVHLLDSSLRFPLPQRVTRKERGVSLS